jgi:hypothetical protein
MREAIETCKPCTLAQSPLALVQCCAHCGTVLVSIGPITLRMDVTALEGLFLTLGEAVEELHGRRERKRPLLHLARGGQS